MAKSQDKRTTAENLEEKFDRGADVLDYFDLPKARVIRRNRNASKQFEYPVKRNSGHRAVVRQKSAGFPKKK